MSTPSETDAVAIAKLRADLDPMLTQIHTITDGFVMVAIKDGKSLTFSCGFDNGIAVALVLNNTASALMESMLDKIQETAQALQASHLYTLNKTIQ